MGAYLQSSTALAISGGPLPVCCRSAHRQPADYLNGRESDERALLLLTSIFSPDIGQSCCSRDVATLTLGRIAMVWRLLRHSGHLRLSLLHPGSFISETSSRLLVGQEEIWYVRVAFVWCAAEHSASQTSQILTESLCREPWFHSR